ncbi:MAG: bifunctional molybdenum cofactor biosynthesis protein MoaC/MoaB [Bacteroidia bacterium]|nr:bifunctional molybdenum cofactor biosynthesis protein MoaC/MoaB [Bacteroidia bacterium]
MIDITSKISTYRKASAQAIVEVSKKETIDAVKNKTVPKGDVFEMAKTAGLFAVKKTSDIIPDCHPIPIEQTSIEYKIQDLQIIITLNAATIYKTGIEVEAMHGASVVALTIYDMLKPIDKEIKIKQIKLLNKKGGKADFTDKLMGEVSASVIVCSDSISKGKKEDKAGLAICDKLKSVNVSVKNYEIIPDEKETIHAKTKKHAADKVDLILICGGTGLSKRDVSPEAVSPLIEREIPGIMEAARNYGQQRMPYAMLSRGVAGMRGNSLIITLPGSTRGAIETMDALFPYVLHIFHVAKGAQH